MHPIVSYRQYPHFLNSFLFNHTRNNKKTVLTFFLFKEKEVIHPNF